MIAPNILKGCTVKQYREQYTEFNKSLQNMAWFLLNANGKCSIPEHLESAVNLSMADFVEAMDYVRERERNNWGWDMNLVDFSKTAVC